MNCTFDFFGRYEYPELILCNPDDSEIGIITNAKDFNPEFCLSDISSISYKIYETDNAEYNSLIYDKHIERRQVKVVGAGYFIITSSSECIDESGKYKQIDAKSCEYELNNIAMPYINGTYQLYKADNFTAKDNEEIAQQGDDYLNENCILYEIMKIIPSWTLDGQAELIGNGAEHSAEMKEKYKALGESFRTFEYSDTTVYSFLTNEIQDSYGCFVHFNIEERKIQILHKEDVFEVLPMVISEANILNSCEVSTTIDSYVNTLNVEGASGVSIASVNPLGNSMLYNFDHDINIGLIDGQLRILLEYWKDKIEKGDKYIGAYYSSNIVQKWLDAPSKLSEYKFKLTDEVGKGENGNISKVLDDDKFLTNIGLSNDEVSLFKKELIKSIEDILTSVEESDVEVNTGAIENIFFKIGRYRINILESQDTTNYMDVKELNRFLYSAQELDIGIKSELDSLKSYKKGYDAQYEALRATETDDSENAKKALDEQLEIVDGYRNIIDESTSQYTELLESITSIIEGVNSVLAGLYKRNSFESRFAEYYESVEGMDSEDAKDKAFKMYKALTRYIKQQTYTDDTIIITDAMGIDEKFTQESELYNSSKNLLEKISIPEYEMSVDSESFLFSKEYKDIISSLSIRSSLYVEVPNGDVPLFHLLKISINYDEPSCELTFGNRIRLSDPTSVFSDLQRTASSAANIIATERIEWGISEEKINELMTQKNSDIDTTFRMMSNSVNKTTMGNDGFKCYSVDENGNPNYGIWCANGVMMFIDKDRDTEATKPKMAIGRMIKSDGSVSYGFYGQSIIANTITADKLTAGAAIKGTNYIKNGSFEKLNDDKIDGWIAGGGNFTSKSINSDSGATSVIVGEKCGLLDVVNSGDKNTASDITQTINTVLTKGRYMFSCYYKYLKTAGAKDPADGTLKFLYSVVNEDGSTGAKQNITAAKSTDEEVYDGWRRVYSVVEIDTPSKIQITIRITRNDSINQSEGVYVDGVYFDGLMLEKSEQLNEYSPHISESYAKYTTIDDSGITVYDGKIRILDGAGRDAFYADEKGNLTLSGIIKAKAGGEIAGWKIGESEIYRDSTSSGGGKMSLSSADNDKIFSYKNNSDVETFSVDKDGNLFISSKLTATDADISGKITADRGKIGAWIIDGNSLKNDNKGELVLTNGLYTTKFDGYGIYGGKDENWGMSITMGESTGESGTWTGMIENAFNDKDKTYDNLIMTGREEITFGVRPQKMNGKYQEAGKIYWNSGFTWQNGFNGYPVFKITAIDTNYLIVGGIKYRIKASLNTGDGLSIISKLFGIESMFVLGLEPI